MISLACIMYSTWALCGKTCSGSRLPFFYKSADFCGFAKIWLRAELVKNAWNSCGFVFLLRNTFEICIMYQGMWYKILKGFSWMT